MCVCVSEREREIMCVCMRERVCVCERLIDLLIELYFSTVKILAQRPTHISAVAERERERERERESCL